MTPTLLILAAGMGSRYGGLKQLDGVGPGGETLLDYAIHDAIRAGFGRVVFVVRRDFEAAFRAQIVARYESQLPISLVFQELDDLPKGRRAPADRVKPWGTGHAVWVARDALDVPFAVINADDFYGREAFCSLAHFLRREAAPNLSCLVGYFLDRTLSPHGAVSRGVCAVSLSGNLAGVFEHTGIMRGGDGRIYGSFESETRILTEDSVASMNCWGLHPQILPGIEEEFDRFLAARADEAKAEFYLPAAITALLEKGHISVKVLTSGAQWFGVTYREDRAAVAEQIRGLVAAGAYPLRLVQEPAQ